MNKLKRILKSQKLFITVLIVLTVYITSNITYTTKALPNIEVQQCDQEAIDILLDIFEEEDIFNPIKNTPLNSDASTENLQRYKLYYDLAFDLCIHSYGYIS